MMTLTPKQQALLDNVMDCFPFHKVALTMDALEWYWFTVDGVPNEMEIRQEARKILKKALIEKTTIGTGGLEATYDKDVDSLLLRFVVAEWEEVGDEQ